MPLGNKEHRTYLTVVGGLICLKVGEATDRAKAEEECPAGARYREILDKTNDNAYTKTVFEKTFTEISGFIVSLEIKKTVFKTQQLNISIEDSIDTYILSLAMNNGYGQEFMRIAMNIDFTKEVRIEVYIYNENSRCSIYQDNKDGLRWWVNKEDMHGFPEVPADWPKYTEWSERQELAYKSIQVDRIEYYKNLIAGELGPKITKSVQETDIAGYYAQKNAETSIESIADRRPDPNLPQQKPDNIPPEIEESNTNIQDVEPIQGPEDDLPF